MKRALIAALVGLTLSGCVVAVEHRQHRYNPPPPPPPPPPAVVTVEWHDARAVVLREYYDCDWDTVGAFEYYEDTCGIPEDDLFFLLHVSRVSGRNFHEVVFTYGQHNRMLWNVCVAYRIDPWSLYVDLPPGTVCPPAYSRAYGYYWRRDRAIRLTNYDCHALFWLRFSVNYYGWRPHDHFTRWDHCVDTRVRYYTVVHKNYHYAGRGGKTWNYGQVKKINDRDRDVTVIRQQRVVVKEKCSNDVKLRDQRGEHFFKPPPRQEIDTRRHEHEKREQEEWKREHEERQKAPRHYGDKGDHKDNPGDKHEGMNDRKDDGRDDRKDDRNDRRPPPPPKRDDGKKDYDKDAPPPPKKDGPPPPKKEDGKKPPPPKKDDGKNPPPPKKDDGNKDDGPKDDGKKDDGKKAPPPPKKDDGKKPPPPPPKKDDGNKDDGSKDDDKKAPPPPKKDDGSKDDGKKDNGGGKDNGKKNQVPDKNRKK